MPNSSVDHHLYGKVNGVPLTWPMRHDIALGLASVMLSTSTRSVCNNASSTGISSREQCHAGRHLRCQVQGPWPRQARGTSQPYTTVLAGTRVHLTVGNRSGYRGNRSYRSGSVRKKLGSRSLTEPSKPLFSVYRSVLPVYRTGFGGLENRSGSGFLNPGRHTGLPGAGVCNDSQGESTASVS
jgi:hypothetical protein